MFIVLISRLLSLAAKPFDASFPIRICVCIGSFIWIMMHSKQAERCASKIIERMADEDTHSNDTKRCRTHKVNISKRRQRWCAARVFTRKFIKWTEMEINQSDDIHNTQSKWSQSVRVSVKFEYSWRKNLCTCAIRRVLFLMLKQQRAKNSQTHSNSHIRFIHTSTQYVNIIYFKSTRLKRMGDSGVACALSVNQKCALCVCVCPLSPPLLLMGKPRAWMRHRIDVPLPRWGSLSESESMWCEWISPACYKRLAICLIMIIILY